MDVTSPDFPNNQSTPSQNLFNLSDEQLLSNLEVAAPQLLSQPTGKFVSSPSTLGL